MPEDETAIDELFGLPLGEFIPARTRLAKELKTAGDSDGAAAVQSLRKPTVSAWAVNQLVRQQRQDVEELLGHGERLREAQRKALSGGGAKELQEAAGRRREMVDRLVEAAGGILEDSGSSAARARLDEIANTLLATATDLAAAEAVRRGRLEKELPPPAGFGDVGELAAVIQMPKRAANRTVERKERAEPAPVQSAARARARKRAGELATEAETAEREADRLLLEAQEAEDEARRLRDEADGADRAAGRAVRTAGRAEQRAAAARDRADRAAARLET
jgi:hypothetical protein